MLKPEKPPAPAPQPGYRGEQRQSDDRVRTIWRPKTNMVWNPLLAYGRNNPCWCDSGKKAKRCCLPNIEANKRCVTAREAQLIQAELVERARKAASGA